MNGECNATNVQGKNYNLHKLQGGRAPVPHSWWRHCSSVWALMAQSSANSISRRMVSITIGRRSETVIMLNTPPSIRGDNLGTESPSRRRGSLQQIVRRVVAKCTALFNSICEAKHIGEGREPGLAYEAVWWRLWICRGSQFLSYLPSP